MLKRNLLSLAVLLFAAALVGCNQPASGPPVAKEGEKKVAKEVEKKTAHTHEGWWCNEHGVPEEECALCSKKVAAACKAKGDWCDKHSRPESQCFICHPEHKAKFAGKYEAKYGKKPPELTADKDEKKQEG